MSAGGIALVAMLSAESGRGDDDQTIDMKEQACKTIRDLCIGDRGNQRPIAEKGAVELLLTILCESAHPWSIREAASRRRAAGVREPGRPRAGDAHGGGRRRRGVQGGRMHPLSSTRSSRRCATRARITRQECARRPSPTAHRPPPARPVLPTLPCCSAFAAALAPDAIHHAQSHVTQPKHISRSLLAVRRVCAVAVETEHAASSSRARWTRTRTASQRRCYLCRSSSWAPQRAKSGGRTDRQRDEHAPRVQYY